MPEKGQFKVLEVVKENVYIKLGEDSKCLLLSLKLLFYHAKILLLEASAVLCLTGPSALSLPPSCERWGNGADDPTELTVAHKPAQCQCTLARSVETWVSCTSPRHQSCLISMRFPGPVCTSELLKSLLTSHQTVAVDFGSSHSWCLPCYTALDFISQSCVRGTVLCLSVTFLL